MAKRKATLLAQVINLLQQLTSDDRRTVADLIRLEQQPGKSKPQPAPAAGRRSTRDAAVNTGAQTVSASGIDLGEAKLN